MAENYIGLILAVFTNLPGMEKAFNRAFRQDLNFHKIIGIVESVVGWLSLVGVLRDFKENCFTAIN